MILLDKSKRPAVARDLRQLIDDEVSKKGLTIKGAYAVVKKLKPDMIGSAVNRLLPAFLEKLEPFYAQGKPLHETFENQRSSVADALLEVTDYRIERTPREALKKVYGKLRPQAKKHVEQALPGLAQVLEKHLARS